jgi:hypothetical protein
VAGAVRLSGRERPRGGRRRSGGRDGAVLHGEDAEEHRPFAPPGVSRTARPVSPARGSATRGPARPLSHRRADPLTSARARGDCSPPSRRPAPRPSAGPGTVQRQQRPGASPGMRHGLAPHGPTRPTVEPATDCGARSLRRWSASPRRPAVPAHGPAERASAPPTTDRLGGAGPAMSQPTGCPDLPSLRRAGAAPSPRRLTMSQPIGCPPAPSHRRACLAASPGSSR